MRHPNLASLATVIPSQAPPMQVEDHGHAPGPLRRQHSPRPTRPTAISHAATSMGSLWPSTVEAAPQAQSHRPPTISADGRPERHHLPQRRPTTVSPSDPGRRMRGRGCHEQTSTRAGSMGRMQWGRKPPFGSGRQNRVLKGTDRPLLQDTMSPQIHSWPRHLHDVIQPLQITRAGGNRIRPGRGGWRVMEEHPTRSSLDPWKSPRTARRKTRGDPPNGRPR